MRLGAPAFLLLASTAPLAAQDTTWVARDTPSFAAIEQHRNPQRARLLGTILPGAGHTYAGEYLRGYGIWVSTISALAVGPIIYEHDGCALGLLVWNMRNCNNRWSSRVLGVFLVGAGAWSWISSARDAPRAAERANARHEGRALRVAPMVAPSAGTGPGLNVGVSVGW